MKHRHFLLFAISVLGLAGCDFIPEHISYYFRSGGEHQAGEVSVDPLEEPSAALVIVGLADEN